MVARGRLVDIDNQTAVSVILDVVRIEIHCGDCYAAQVLFDDIVDHLQAGEGVTIKQKGKGKS